jgi:hypothetical protein
VTLQSSTRLSARRPLHIISTKFLEGNEVLVGFSDGTSAIYEAEELEKLRPARKQTAPECPALMHSDGSNGPLGL